MVGNSQICGPIKFGWVENFMEFLKSKDDNEGRGKNYKGSYRRGRKTFFYNILKIYIPFIKIRKYQIARKDKYYPGNEDDISEVSYLHICWV